MVGAVSSFGPLLSFSIAAYLGRGKEQNDGMKGNPKDSPFLCVKTDVKIENTARQRLRRGC